MVEAQGPTDQAQQNSTTKSGGPVDKKPMVNNFSRNILKRVVGAERASQAF